MTETSHPDAALTSGEATDIEDGRFPARSIDGRLDLSGFNVRRKLLVDGGHFRHPFVADSATFTGLHFKDCTFDCGLAIRNGRIRGDVVLENCTFPAGSGPAGSDPAGSGPAASDPAAEPPALDLRGSSVEGGIKLQGGSIAGDCLLDRVALRGNLRIGAEARLVGTLSLTGARVDSRLDLSGCTLGEVVLNGAILGALWIGTREPVRCTGFYATDTNVRTFARFTRFTVRALGEAPARSKRLHLEEPGTIAFRGCRFGSLFSTWIIKRYGEEEDGWQEDNCVVAETAFLFTDCIVEGELTLTRLRVGAEALLDPKGGGRPWGEVRLDRSRVGGAFLILSPISVATRFELSAAARRKARALVVAGDAMNPDYRSHMRTLSMRGFHASYVDLSGLDLRSCGRDDPDGANDGCLVADRLVVDTSLTTYAWSAHLDRGKPGRRAYAQVPGAMRLRGASVGELRLAAESFGVAGGKAWSDGVVLELADISQLRVPPRDDSAESDHCNAFPVPLDLSGLTVRHWNFDEDVNAEGTGLVDDYLDFLDNDEKLHREVYRSVAAALRDVGRDEDAEKIIYTEETRAYWERHHPDKRWPPYPRAGRRGLRRSKRADRIRAFLRGLFHPSQWHPFEWADRYLLLYRRNPIRLLYVILGLLLVSTLFVSSRPANFELSDSSRLVLENAHRGRDFSAGISYRPSGLNIGPDERHWGPWNAVWMSIRYHVPIIPMVVEDEYVASNDNRLDIGLPLLAEPARWRPAGDDPGKVWFTAEDWFALMSILNWIMWPLLLTFALRRALRAE